MKSTIHLLVCSLILQCASSCPSIGQYTAITETDLSPPIAYGSNGTSKFIRKRGYPVYTRDIWPNGKITYCFADDTARTKLKDIIPKAWGMWLTANANVKLEMEEGDTDYCKVANRHSYLRVSYNEQNKLVTTPGSNAGIGQAGPSMDLDPRDGFATGSGMSNIAHEIGHAWGLLHEHQRPSLWTEHYGGTGQRNVFQFHCQNLKDYATVQARGNDMTRLCRYMQAASAAQDGPFSAVDLLPDTRGKDSGNADVIDWFSIMIYGSTAGGALVNGQTQYTLTKADGTIFRYNLWPSPGDIETLNKLYAEELDNKKMGKVKMLWKKANAKHGLFLQRNKGSSCQ